MSFHIGQISKIIGDEKGVVCIDGFQGDYRFLSNFFIEPDQSHVEAEYQQAKTIDPLERNLFISKTGIYTPPGRCKKLGRRVKLRTDWDQVKLDIMFELVMNKFAAHLDLQAKLLSTGNAELIEGNAWGDTFYGMCNGEGENHLGKILMKVREMLR